MDGPPRRRQKLARDQDEQRAAYEALHGDREAHEKLRRGYERLSADFRRATVGGRADLKEADFDSILRKANELSEGAARPRERCLDAELLLGLSAKLKDAARELHGNQGLSAKDFIAALKAQFGRRPLGEHNMNSDEDDGAPPDTCFDWVRLGNLHAAALFAPAHTFTTMLGPLEAEPPRRRAQGQRRQREAVGQAVAPEEIEEEEGGAGEQREKATEERAKHIYKAIKRPRQDGGRGGVSMIRLVIDPHSFSETVENIFALTFLIRDGRCQLRPGSAPGLDNILIDPKNAPSEEDKAAGRVTNTQCILRLDYADWKKLSRELLSSQQSTLSTA